LLEHFGHLTHDFAIPIKLELNNEHYIFQELI